MDNPPFSALRHPAYQQSMIDVFWPALTVTPGTQYFLAMNVPRNGYDLTRTYSVGNTYGGGASYNGNTTSSTAPYADYGQYAYDLTFEEFASSQVTTPEPASLALLATGLFGLVPMMRRKVWK